MKQSLLLSERTYRCNLCGFECDRDGNAVRIQAYTGHSELARRLQAFVDTRLSAAPSQRNGAGAQDPRS